MSRVERIDDDVFALTDLVPVDGRVSWHDPQGEGFEPHNKYVILEADRALMIDTGYALHGPSLIPTLREAIGKRALTVLLTRSELDCLGNVPRVVASFDSVQVVTTSSLPPIGLVHLDGKTRGQVPVDLIKMGEPLAASGFARVKTMQPVVKLLGTCWAYDEKTGTLFVSDFFGAALMKTANDIAVLSQGADLPDREAIRRTLLAKFSWLARAEIHEVLAVWDRAFADFRPRAIAPAHGRPIVGADLVAKTLADYRAAVAACRDTIRA